MKKDFSASQQEAKMTINDLHCIFNMPKALKSRVDEGHEVAQGLPPWAPRKTFKVDDYECPTTWMHGSNLASSYFVPIRSECGMWLDFNQCWGHTHHIGILISVQGVNPLDGQSMVDDAFSLRQYRHKCPLHDVDFGADRFCEKCGYKWVPQNYLATTGTPYGLLWLDGFLASDGVVRQYYFTEEEAKGVAHQIIGAEKKVYSIGVAFYLSKEPKPILTPPPSTNQYVNSTPDFMWQKSIGYYGGNDVGGSWQNCASPPGMKDAVSKRAILRSRKTSLESIVPMGLNMCDTSPDCVGTDDMLRGTKSFDIAAGAKIDQKVYPDPNDLDFWQDKPAGLLYINYCSEEQAIAILQKKKDRTKGGEGFLAGLKTGN